MEGIGATLVSGSDLSTKGGTDTMLMRDVLTCLPAPPVAADAPLAHALAARAPSDGIDRISSLPVDILRDVVSRLPAKDAARTTVLSTSWRGVWHSVPLVLVDAHLVPIYYSDIIRILGRDTDPRDFRTPPLSLAAAVSGALAAHPGPFRCVYLTGSNIDTHDVETARWFQILAAKGVKELVFVNRAKKQMDINAHPHLPVTLFKCTSLTKLYLGFWLLPETAKLPRSATFPHLREVGLCSLVMKAQDLAFLLDRCPVLEKLVMVGCKWPVCLRIQSQSLRCVQVSYSIVPEITISSLLERLLLWEAWGGGGLTNMSSTIKISHAPHLKVLGMLVPGMHQLQIGNTIIKAGTKASPNTIVPSVQVLAIQMRVGTRIEAKMLPSFLRCFPNVEILYIQSENDDFKFWGPQSGGTGKVSLKFWEKAGPIECIQRHVKKLVIRLFRGTKSEINFLKFIVEHARVLEKVEIVLPPESPPSSEVDAKLRTSMASAKWANGCCELTVSPYQGTPWCYRRGFDLTNQDPFDVSKCREGKCQSH